MRAFFVLAILSLCVQACTVSPKKERNVDNRRFSEKIAGKFSTESIKKEREAVYTQKLLEIRSKKPSEDVMKAVKSNDLHLLGFKEGRGGYVTIPNIAQPQALSIKCRTVQLDGMGDSIYGENHFAYREEVIKYASEFNRLMSAHCR